MLELWRFQHENNSHEKDSHEKNSHEQNLDEKILVLAESHEVICIRGIHMRRLHMRGSDDFI